MGNIKNKKLSLHAKARIKSGRPLPTLPLDVMPNMIRALQEVKYKAGDGLGMKNRAALRHFSMINKAYRSMIFHQQFKDMKTTPKESWDKLMDVMPEESKQFVTRLEVVAPSAFMAESGDIFDVAKDRWDGSEDTSGFQTVMWKFIGTLPNLTELIVDPHVGPCIYENLCNTAIKSLSVPYPILPSAYLESLTTPLDISTHFPSLTHLTIAFHRSAVRKTQGHFFMNDWDSELPSGVFDSLALDINLKGIKKLTVNFADCYELEDTCGLKVCAGLLSKLGMDDVEELVLQIGQTELYYQGRKVDPLKHLIPWLSKIPNLQHLSLHISAFSCETFLSAQPMHIRSFYGQLTQYLNSLDFESSDISKLFVALSKDRPKLISFQYKVVTSNPKRKDPAWLRRRRGGQGPPQGLLVREWVGEWVEDTEDKVDDYGNRTAKAEGAKKIHVLKDEKRMDVVDQIQAAIW